MFSSFRGAVRPIAFACLLLTARGAWAHGDITLFDAAGQVGVGLIDVGEGVFEPGERVFEALLSPKLIASFPFDFDSDEPGFDVPDGALPANEPIVLTVKSLTYWDGVGEPLFAPAAGTTFGFDTDPSFATDADGGLHDHALFGLNGAAPDGVYVGEFTAAVAGLEESDPVFMVMLKDALLTKSSLEDFEEALEQYEEGGAEPVIGGKNFAFYEEAVESVEASLVPEPASFVLVTFAFLASCFRRR
ncbi:hypothetical protein Mal64_33260 [Pseudobythopirellula maris]|uniref:PEP-CTERM protein-sorting domain-containing protein n=1 Tax=Pseudobythopirellula maris TaxID=2527991 RepID=A0A5C5ZHA2_9BACT|nr:hypothetical protein [Pseudobythopirellula maris]TWT86500.1 hypothetical protein Mal64_33260 [Pseudobythopirellula maris]